MRGIYGRINNIEKRLSLTKAIETLVSFLDNKDVRLKRLASKDVIEYIIKHKEIEDLDKRLAAIEQQLSK